MDSLMQWPFCEYYQGKSEICPDPPVTTQDTVIQIVKILKTFLRKYFNFLDFVMKKLDDEEIWNVIQKLSGFKEAILTFQNNK